MLVALAQAAVENQPISAEFWRAGIKAIAEGSASMVSWALALGGGSIVTIVSTSYLRPPRKMRLTYFLFVPGWALLSLSVYHGDAISSHYLAAQVGKAELLRSIALDMSPEYADQQQYLGYALGVFGLWLLTFLVWWIFGEPQVSSKES